MEWLQNMDESILLFIQEWVRCDFMTPFWKSITSMGNGGAIWIVFSVLLLLRKETRKTGLLSLISMLLGYLVTNIYLKEAVMRERPFFNIEELLLLIPKPHDFSFPSGHTCSSFAAAGVFYHLLDKRQGIFALVLACMIAFSRLYVGVHYPSDVLVGMVVGVLAARIICAFLAEDRGKKEKVKKDFAFYMKKSV